MPALRSYEINYRELFRTKKERGAAVARVERYRRPGVIISHQQHKRRIVKDLKRSYCTNTRTMRDDAFRMWEGIGLDKIVLKDDPTEFKRRLRNKLEAIRNMRLTAGVPPVFTDDPSRPYWRCPQSFYIPEGEWERAKKAGVEFSEVHVRMRLGRAIHLTNKIETKIAHHGMWTYYTVENEEAEDEEGRCTVRWAFEHATDLVWFKMRYGCE